MYIVEKNARSLFYQSFQDQVHVTVFFVFVFFCFPSSIDSFYVFKCIIDIKKQDVREFKSLRGQHITIISSW